ncbi:hypothetical protein HELRODRAFT_159218 [Helobdella robusta]|uniref:Methyltransferase domain-containing protein n=1 Tax=Helobdella robusta TaxID=6412 RepID=T1ENR3_HELRO|nr:hypothetical protein HELRODRAFT_159218 [Helobdella robusta]ESO12643.1 hypothetical protein HELRODRAFT_159218 [Helobdella robusta]
MCFALSLHKYNAEHFSESLLLANDLKKNMNPKKVHEVERMAKFIDMKCKELDCKYIIDIGSGMGYLGFVMTKLLDYKVLGIEISEKMSRKTNARAENGESGIPDMCLVGLHCCGDLSVSTIKTFCQLKSIKLLLLFSCCYHSMKQNDDRTFENFPLSSDFKFLNQHYCLNLYSFRLAAQQTRSSWKLQTSNDHHLHMLNVGYRSILELACHKYGLAFKKNHRKLTKICNNTSFPDYLNSICSRSTLTIDHSAMNKILALYQTCHPVMKLIEPFTMLQVMFQPIIELLILEDRCRYVKEQGFNCKVVQVFDDQVSSRNCAILAHK